jgi:hypothetical protein
MFPFVPVIALIAILGGGATLVWYDQLNKEEKEKADRIASDYARRIYHKSLEDLSEDQAKRVAALTQRHFSN